MTFLHPRLERIICVSDAVRTSLCAVGIAAHKLQRIYKGHDPAWYCAVAPVALSEFSIPPGAFVVCCVANMRELKGVDTLIEAFASIPADLPIHLLLVGEVRDPNVRERAARVDAHRIHFAGYRADASAIVSSATLNVLLSRRREGLPKGIIEGMAQSVPAIVSAVGGMPELVRDGIDGVVVAPERPEAVAKAILRFFHDEPFLMRARTAARERIERDFHISATIEQTAAVYQELVLGKR
jgi:glycosyltransferase involved in cell wall biosynthesis